MRALLYTNTDCNDDCECRQDPRNNQDEAGNLSQRKEFIVWAFMATDSITGSSLSRRDSADSSPGSTYIAAAEATSPSPVKRLRVSVFMYERHANQLISNSIHR